MGYRLKIYFTDGSEELLDDIFDTEDEAEAEYYSWLENWETGRETLMLAGEDYIAADIDGRSIWEED